MSVASATKKVARCKEALRLAYDELYAEREQAQLAKRASKVGELAAANERLERFCTGDRAILVAVTEGGLAIKRLPLRLRFVATALALEIPRSKIAEALPKLNGKGGFVRMGLTKGGLHKLIVQARYELERLRDL